MNAPAVRVVTAALLIASSCALADWREPHDFASCTAVSGTWYGKCVRVEGKTCREASRTEGICGGYAIPKASTAEACAARKGHFIARCLRWEEADHWLKVGMYCAEFGKEGACRRIPAFEELRDLFELTRPGGRIRYPEFTEPGTTWSEFDAKRQEQLDHWPPTNHASCTALEGTWLGVCSRVEGGRCVSASLEVGQCGGFINPRAYRADQFCDAWEFPRSVRFEAACLAWRTDRDGVRTCAAGAPFGKCRQLEPMNAGHRLTDLPLFAVRPDGTIDTAPSARPAPPVTR